MPLRDLIYVSKVLQGQMKDQDIYSSRQIKLPTPKFVVFYNGTDEQPEKQTLRLSDAYEKRLEEVELELTVTVYNINYGHNQKLLEACQTLKEYAQYVAVVREYAKEMPLAEAVESAVDSCIRQGILADFLRKNRAEAIEMSIFEYDEEKHLKSEREIWLAEGTQAGIEKGIASEIVSMGLECGLSKEQVLHRLQAKLNISEQTAKEYFEQYRKEPIRI